MPMIQGRFPESKIIPSDSVDSGQIPRIKNDPKMIPMIQGRFPPQRSVKFNVSNSIEFGGSLGEGPHRYVYIYIYTHTHGRIYYFGSRPLMRPGIAEGGVLEVIGASQCSVRPSFMPYSWHE